MIKTINIIGSGNLATQLALTLHKHNFTIKQIYSRNKINAEILAEKINAKATDSLTKLYPNVDLIIISVTDNALQDVINKMPNTNAIVVHTSGSVNMNILNRFENYGVFYPFQTFSKQHNVDFNSIPILLETKNPNVNTELLKLSKTISNNVTNCNSEQRGAIHLAAVFACNFTNYMYSVAHDLLTSKNIDFNILKPLIKETTSKILTNNSNHPKEIQTGPAVREDYKIINKHINSLEDNNYKNIYKLLTEGIIKMKK